MAASIWDFSLSNKVRFRSQFSRIAATSASSPARCGDPRPSRGPGGAVVRPFESNLENVLSPSECTRVKTLSIELTSKSHEARAPKYFASFPMVQTKKVPVRASVDEGRDSVDEGAIRVRHAGGTTSVDQTAPSLSSFPTNRRWA
jgi:hypothetical protein